MSVAHSNEWSENSGSKPSSDQADRKPVRVNLAMPPALIESVQRLAVETHASSITEVFRRALLLYADLHEAHKAGKAILIRSPNENEPIERLKIFL